VAGELFAAPMPERALVTESDRSWHRWRQQAAIDRALSQHSVDVIHVHGLDFDQHVLPPDIPVVVTLHLPLHWYRPEVWQVTAEQAQFVCVSQSQRRSCEPVLGAVRVIENGVTLPPLRLDREREDFALALGRICPEKNVHEALEAGTLAGTRVLIGGHVFPYREHGDYFQGKVEPLLSGEGSSHRFLGALETERRQRLLARAKCLLHPTRAPETSSLVAMESLAAGTPVIAYRSGALPEIVEDGVTGFLVDNVEEMARAIGRVGELRRQDCRAAAERRFSSERMAREYMELYAQMASGQRAVKYA
jgi:glycosyltransferase involved in cell wall biosynthesis